MKNIKQVYEVVKNILEKNPKARNSGNELYGWVCLAYNESVRHLDFLYVLNNQNDLGIPKFETVRRSRQKIQAEYPDLQASNEVTEERYENWKAVRKFAVE